MRNHLTPTITILLTLLLFLPPLATGSAALPTQREWMTNLVDTLGYAFGLPDKPTDLDYAKILDGRREFRFEAEDTRDPDDLIAINSFNNFGEFSGSGWVCAISAPTRTRLSFLLPFSGTYRFFASIRLSGHTVRAGGKSFLIEGPGTNFQRVDLGEIFLDAGQQTVEIDLVPNGSIDYIEFISPPLPRIAPLDGWQVNQPLTIDDMAVTVARALELEAMLPLSGETLTFEAEQIADPQSFVTDQRHLGEPSGGAWIRARTTATDLNLSFALKNSGVYEVFLRAEGDLPLRGCINHRDDWTNRFPSYLEDGSLGTWFLASGVHHLLVHLPPLGGVDSLTLKGKRFSGADYRTLIGLPQTDIISTPEQANRLLTLLARLHRLE